MDGEPIGREGKGGEKKAGKGDSSWEGGGGEWKNEGTDGTEVRGGKGGRDHSHSHPLVGSSMGCPQSIEGPAKGEGEGKERRAGERGSGRDRGRGEGKRKGDGEGWGRAERAEKEGSTATSRRWG